MTRFGPKPVIARMADDMLRGVSLESYDRLAYQTVSPTRLRPCPETYNGIDWERWILSVEGGCIVRVVTVFQVSSSCRLFFFLLILT